MSRFTDTLKAPAAPSRAVPATRQGRTHVGVYVLPTWRTGFACSPRSNQPARRRSSSRLSRCCFGHAPGRPGRGVGKASRE